MPNGGAWGRIGREVPMGMHGIEIARRVLHRAGIYPHWEEAKVDVVSHIYYTTATYNPKIKPVGLVKS